MGAPPVTDEGEYWFGIYDEWTSALLMDVLLDATRPVAASEAAAATGEPLSDVNAWLDLFERVALTRRVPTERSSPSWVLNDGYGPVDKLRDQHAQHGPPAGGKPLSRLNRHRHGPGFDQFASGPQFLSANAVTPLRTSSSAISITPDLPAE